MKNGHTDKLHTSSAMGEAKERNILELVRIIEDTGDFRVLKRVPHPAPTKRPIPENERIGIILDTETTGLDVEVDEAFELAMIAFTYRDDGYITGISNTHVGRQQPGHPLSPEIERITGVRNSDLIGAKFDVQQISNFAERAAVIIAHNAAFDRPISEKISPVFSGKAWACSQSEIQWSQYGFEGTKLVYLLMQHKMFYDAHRALDDCYALIALLASSAPGTNRPWLKILLDNARIANMLIRVSRSFDHRVQLRKRGYKWLKHRGQSTHSWSHLVREADLEDELRHLTKTLGIDRKEIDVVRQTAFTRFR